MAKTTVHTKFGLTLVRAGDNDMKELDEVHIISNDSEKAINAMFGTAEVIRYDMKNQYPIDACLERIGKLYGDKIQNVVKLMLDYN
jgi:hypothetical protein